MCIRILSFFPLSRRRVTILNDTFGENNTIPSQTQTNTKSRKKMSTVIKFEGQWRTTGHADPAVFDFVSSSLVTVQRASTGPEPVPHQWSVSDDSHFLRLTGAPPQPTTTTYRIVSAADDLVTLALVDEAEPDNIETLVLVPKMTLASTNDSLVEEDSGTDMGMDLCVTGTAVKLHPGQQ